MKKVIYDIECLPNFFCVVYREFETGKKAVAEISSRRNDTDLIRVIARKYTLVGYNNHGYDDPLIEHVVRDNVTNESLYRLSSILVKDKFARTDTERKLMNKYKYNKSFDSIDVMTMLASSKLRVSLKHLQVKIKWHNVLDFECDWTEPLPEERWDECIDYCDNDVESLRAVYQSLGKDIKLREWIEEKYKIDVRSKDGVQIAETMLCTGITDNTGEDLNEFMYAPQEKTLAVIIEPLILPFISFKTAPFQAVLDHYKSKVYQVDGEEGQLGYILKHNNLKFVCGSGGLHCESKGRILRMERGKYKLIQSDVEFAS